MLGLARVAGHSMTPTFHPDDLLLTLRSGARRPHRGDVVVLERDGVRMIKRVVGDPGAVVTMEAGHLAVDGVPIDGRPRAAGALVRRWTVPRGHVFVAGDNPGASLDSRVWPDPFVSLADVHAIVLARLHPRRRATTRPTAPSARLVG